MSGRKTPTRIPAKHLSKPVRNRASHAEKPISVVDEIVPASGTSDLGTIQKKAIHGKRRDWCRYTVAKTSGSKIQEKGYERERATRTYWGQSVKGEEGGGRDAVQGTAARGGATARELQVILETRKQTMSLGIKLARVSTWQDV